MQPFSLIWDLTKTFPYDQFSTQKNCKNIVDTTWISYKDNIRQLFLYYGLSIRNYGQADVLGTTHYQIEYETHEM